VESQFPVLAPLSAEEEPERADPDSNTISPFDVARDWYTYAVAPMPPPQPEISGVPNYDPRKYRMPRYMASSIFRGYPSRGQAYVAETFQKEGWFDRDGWTINGWFNDNRFHDGGEPVVGKEQDWASHAWTKAFDMYRKHGIASGLYLTPEQIEDLNQRASKYRKAYGMRPDEQPREVSGERSAELEPGFKAHSQLYWYARLQSMTNFPHFYFSTQAESEPQTIAVRKSFFVAEQFRKSGDRELALETYEKALPKWRDVLLAHAEFRADESTQDDAFDINLKYIELVRNLHGRRIKEISAIADYLGQRAGRAVGELFWQPPVALVRGLPPGILTPLDGTDSNGNLLIGWRVRMQNKDKLGFPVEFQPQAGTQPPQGRQRPGGKPRVVPPPPPRNGA
jgi:hypothetical protein